MVIIRKKHVETAEEKEIRLKKEADLAVGIQDQYQARGFELVSWVQDHKVVVSALIAVLLAGGALFSGYLYYKQRTNEMATSAFLAAIKDIDSPAKVDKDSVAKWQKAQADLKDLAASYKGSGVSILANLYAGHLALGINDVKGSMDSYQNALNNIKKTDPLYALALIGLAYSRERNGESKEALQDFESVIELKEGVGKDLALWEAARLSHDINDNEKTKKYLARLLEEFPASAYDKNAKRLKEVVQ